MKNFPGKFFDFIKLKSYFMIKTDINFKSEIVIV